jgi:hypothetical protein
MCNTVHAVFLTAMRPDELTDKLVRRWPISRRGEKRSGLHDERVRTMRYTSLSSLSLIAAAVLLGAAGPVHICQAGKLTCATTMPVGGYCECTSQRNTQDGTVVSKPEPHRKVNATAGGCGAHPGAPGCP